MIQQLLKLADSLDRKGFYKEANRLVFIVFAGPIFPGQSEEEMNSELSEMTKEFKNELLPVFGIPKLTFCVIHPSDGDEIKLIDGLGGDFEDFYLEGRKINRNGLEQAKMSLAHYAKMEESADNEDEWNQRCKEKKIEFEEKWDEFIQRTTDSQEFVLWSVEYDYEITAI